MNSALGVQGPDEARVAAEMAARAAAAPRTATAPTAPPVAAVAAAAETAEGEGEVIQFPGSHETAALSDGMAWMLQLRALYDQGKLEPEHVELGPMPKHATKTMIDVAADMQLWFGLVASQGFQRPLMYAASMAKEIVGTPRGAAKVLDRLVAAEVWRRPGEMPPRGQPRGTFVYIPPGWWPRDPEARAIVEATGKHPDAANLDWAPDDQDGGAA